MKQLLPLALACTALPLHAQAPQPTPPAAARDVQTPSTTAAETSRISHLVAGPDGRPQGFLLRNGTFVTLSPGLAQQMPTTVRRNTTVRVRGPEYASSGQKTIQAQTVTIAGVAYKDVAGSPMMPAAAGVAAPPRLSPGTPGAAPPPPPGGAPGAVPPPPPPPVGGPGAVPPPPPPPPCGVAAAPPPPATNPQTPPAPTGAAPAPPPVGAGVTALPQSPDNPPATPPQPTTAAPNPM